MKKEEFNLDQIEKKNPFKVPNGYMEGLADQIMQDLPEKQTEPTREIFFLDRVRPWLYMAAVFIGLGLFFKAIIDIDSIGSNRSGEVLLVRTEIEEGSTTGFEQTEDEEYLEYLEGQYVDFLLNEEFLSME